MNLPKRHLTFSFVAVLAIFLGLLIVWMNSTVHHKQYMDYLYAEREKTRLLTQLLEAANQRTITVHKMAIEEDPFAQDNYFMTFNLVGNKVVIIRERLLNEFPSFSTTQIWESIKPRFAAAKTAAEKAIDLIQRG